MSYIRLLLHSASLWRAEELLIGRVNSKPVPQRRTDTDAGMTRVAS